ncbi:MAG: glycosyltransferase family 4 protein, partial [Daejeonella sp.]
MNILILHSSSDLYGASNILLIVIRNLINNGHHVVVVLSEDGPLVGKLKDLEVEVHLIKLGVLRRKYYSVSGLLNRIKTIRNALKILTNLTKQKYIDLIYSNTTGVLVGALLSKKLKIRHIWHVHEIIQKPKLFSKIISYLLNKYSERVIVVSDAVKYNWERWVNNSKLVRIYNGINCDPFKDKSASLRTELN